MPERVVTQDQEGADKVPFFLWHMIDQCSAKARDMLSVTGFVR